ncbi:MAG: YdcF family protein [Alphaproteobacteria bacterium]|nr:YdcF family protein [Alphaproteobacteria bacterium]
MDGVSLTFLAKAAAKALLLPPGCLAVFVLAAWYMGHRGRIRAAAALVASGVALVLALSLPLASRALTSTLVRHPPFDGDARGAQAIVVLGGGMYPEAPEFGGDTAGAASLQRVRYGVRVARRTGLPVLVSGGRPLPTRSSEAETMRRLAEDELGQPVRWVEDRSEDTRDNAEMSRAILGLERIDRIVLVTSADHMLRAELAFRQAGFDVIPAPTLFPTYPRLTAVDLVPSSGALHGSANALNHWFGFLVYALRGLLSPGGAP